MRDLVLILTLVSLLAGCTESPPVTTTPTVTTPTNGGASTMTIKSSAFADRAAIPLEHTCDGAGTSPPLVITGLQASTMALLVIDPDVPIPQAPTRTFTHWVAFNIPITDGIVTFPAGGVPPGTIQGKSSSDKVGWAPPCPPQGSPSHRYIFTAYGVAGELPLQEGASREDVAAALEERMLGNATLTGCYMRVAPVTPC